MIRHRGRPGRRRWPAFVIGAMPPGDLTHGGTSQRARGARRDTKARGTDDGPPLVTPKNLRPGPHTHDVIALRTVRRAREVRPGRRGPMRFAPRTQISPPAQCVLHAASACRERAGWILRPTSNHLATRRLSTSSHPRSRRGDGSIHCSYCWEPVNTLADDTQCYPIKCERLTSWH